MDKKKLYMITGFLGAGKTTFVKNLFNTFKDRKIAVIVNEFGKEGVDGTLLKQEGIAISEISNGSIFCVCRSDLFIDTLVQASKRDVDIIIVETSGLADPTNMPEILESAERLSHNAFDYRGTIAIVDACNFEKVIKTALAVERQIKSASLILINKTDLVDKEKIKEVEEEIKSINEKARIEMTTFGEIKDVSWIDDLDHYDNEDLTNLIKLKMIGQQKIFIKMEDNYKKEKVVKWINSFKDMTYRIKGFVNLDGSFTYIDGVNGNIEYKNIKTNNNKFGIVILASGTKPVVKQVKEAWKKNFEVEIEL